MKGGAPIQGAAADIIRRAMIRIPGALSKDGLSKRILLQVHDELVFEAQEGEAERALASSVPLVFEAKAAGNWDEAH